MSIMHEILDRRRARVRAEGHALGVEIPAERRVPVIRFGREPFVICELKRRSPSKGEISATLDAVAQGARYASLGAKSLSVLTEEDHFSGSLTDLIKVKEANPDLCVLRKDFLLDPEDIDVSFRAGADVVLLIAGALSRERLEELYRRASALGMACLVEVHSTAEAEKVAMLKPEFTGVNARDLESFAVDPILPLVVRRAIGWKTRAVFESGIHAREHALFAAAGGFDGVLVGEAVVRNPSLIGELVAGLEDGRAASGRGAGARGNLAFWSSLYARKREGRPLVKVCGLTRSEEAHVADDLGADLLGFVLAPSKRRAEPSAVSRVGRTRALKVGVVVLDRERRELPAEVRALLEEGSLDALQFHGDEQPGACASLAYPYYKALQLAGPEETKRIDEFLCPRVLIDAYSKEARGGTGRKIDRAVLEAARGRPLWLAGGITPDNVRELIETFEPELVDSSSGLEAEPGRKDPGKLERFFAEVESAIGALKPR